MEVFVTLYSNGMTHTKSDSKGKCFRRMAVKLREQKRPPSRITAEIYSAVGYAPETSKATRRDSVLK